MSLCKSRGSTTASLVAVAAALAYATLSAPPAFGHHSYAMFDMDRQITLRGTLKELQWTNPHIWLQVVVRDAETGQEVEWSIEGASPNMLRRRGWTRNSVAVGAEVELVVFPVKVGGKPNTGSLSSLKADGKPIFNRQDGPQEDAGR